MLVTFNTPATGSIVMFGDIAVRLIKLAGHSGNVPGTLLPEDLPQAIRLLKTAVEDHAASDAGTNSTNNTRNNEEAEYNDESSISLQNRAFPLIQLLEAAKREEVYVVWES